MYDQPPRWEEEVNDILRERYGNIVPPSDDPQPPINIFCCYHIEDKSLWKQLNKHIQALKLQRKNNPRPLSWSTVQLNHEAVPDKQQVKDQIEHAHILICMMSVDTILALWQTDSDIAEALYRRSREKRSFKHPPFVLCIEARAVQWNQVQINRLRTLPSQPLGTLLHKDGACVEICNLISDWIEQITHQNLEQDKTDHPTP